MNSSKSELLGNYDVKKLLIKLSTPAILGMAVNGLYNFVDALFVGLAAEEIAIGALAIAFPVHMIIIAFALMIGVGGASVFSRAFGRKDRGTMTNVVNTALRLDFVLALFITVFGLFFLNELLVLFGATASNIDYAKEYLGIILLGVIPMSLQMVLNNFSRAEGRANIAMISMMLGAGLNILIDPIFIFEEINIFNLFTITGLGLGVKGAAIATVISQVVGFSFIFSMALSKKSELRINLKNWFEIHLKTLKEILIIGGPTLIRNTIWAFLAIIIYQLINNYADGDPAIYISIYGVINRVFFFIFLPGYGVVQGLVPIVGYNFGAKKPERIKEVIIYATKIVVIYFTLGFVFVQVFAPAIFDLFSSSNDTFFIEYGTDAFRTISIGYVLVGFHIILGAVYQALGYPKRALLVAVSRQLLLFIPIVLIFTPIFGIGAIWVTFFVADLIAGTLCMFLMLYEIKQLNKNI